MPRIVRRPQALRDAAELWAYIAQHSSPDQADKFADRIDRKAGELARHPLSGRSRNELRLGLRSSTVGRYLLFYLPLSDGIDVLRILYGGRNLTPALFNDDEES